MSLTTPNGSFQAVGNEAARSLRTPSLIAGSALLFLVALSVFGNFAVLENLISQGDGAGTAAEISGSGMLFRMGIAALVAAVVLDAVIAAALFEVFASVNRSLSMMAAWFRLAYSAVFLVAICRLLEVPALLDDGERVLHAVDGFNTVWKVGLILFGFHLMLIGYLAYRSRFMASIFGMLLVINGIGYIADGFAVVLVSDYSFSFAQFVFVGETALIFWLLIRGRRVITGHQQAQWPATEGSIQRPAESPVA
ncbi:DUF4386 domain-containing protein [Arthrobacter sp. ISL-28]|uniref:DUF4386 domain-containing protein n=1 Tax=Arthrobacter sp. ISL-28 TaxID=2819108 RepID=UPI001BE5AFB1|nr:DUF4386 domain-containing protein [Arthrobacter sp. ISL-28]MBT2523535.1 DUF4386 domain-containing protein [Arthrobacter sp. ISL-28]